MVRVINQETFDCVVQENMEELDMSVEEAISSAIEQFKAQGVDLTNIIIEADSQTVKDNLAQSLSILKSAVEKHPEKSDEIMSSLTTIQAVCRKGMSHQILAGKLETHKILLDTLSSFHINDKVRRATLNTLTVLMTGYPDLLDTRGIDALFECLQYKNLIGEEAILSAALQWSHQCCVKHERNRQALIQRGIADIITCLMSKILEHNLNRTEPTFTALLEILRETCELIRVLILDDDVRESVSRSHEHARSLALNNLVLLTRLLKKVEKEPAAASLVIATLSVLVVRNEFCETVDEGGALECIREIFVNFPTEERVNTQCLWLMKALAGNDRVKSHIVEKGLIPFVTSLMRRFESSKRVQSAACNVIAALALRNVAACSVLVANDAPEAIIEALKQHANVRSVQRPACLAIRNIVARSKELNSEFLKLGVEDLLKQIEPQEGGDEAKAALRDLGCFVKFAEPFTGEIGNKLAN